MEQQNSEEKSLKTYYAQCKFRNSFGLKSELADILAEFMMNFYEKFFDDFDAEKVEHYRNASSNMGLMPKISYGNKIEFYIGLMDKDTKNYKYSIEEAKSKVFEVLGDCTIIETKGSYTNDEGKQMIMDTLVATKVFEEVPVDFEHNTAYKLKEIFNQKSILTVGNHCKLEYNDESEQKIRYIKGLMEDYDLSWDMAKHAMEAGF